MSRNNNNNNNNNNLVNETVSFFAAAYEGVDPNDVRSLVVAHTDARGNVDQEAIIAALESMMAPKVEAPVRRTREDVAAAAASAGPLGMNLRPIMDGGCVGCLTVSPAVLATHATGRSEPPRFIAILDRSGSMGNSVRRLINSVLPAVARKLGIPADEKSVIVVFDHTVQRHTMTIRDMEQSRLDCGGRTYMAPAIREASRAVMAHPERNVRLLVLSDGELHDQDDTCKQSTQLAQELRSVRVSSQAVRFFTSSAQPDTRGLASVLALNSSVGDAQLMDLSASMDDKVIVDSIFQAFEHDGLDVAVELECDEPILMANPWMEPSRTVCLRPGDNFIWFKQTPTGKLRLKGTDTPVDFEVTNRVSVEDVSGALKPLMDSYLQRLKVLKVVNTPATVAEMQAILAYFERFETFIQSSDVSVTELLQNRSIRSRLEYFRTMAARRRSSLYGIMAEIANDDKVAKLSSAQQADYLRQVEGQNRNAKALARRALGHGIDFSATLQAEVRAMRARFGQELASLDDKDHAVSFYSMESTLGGIRALCSLDDATLGEMEATDIIQIANIVGVPCVGPIGNFVDPMTWRVEQILPGVHLSLSDILIAHVQSGGRALTAPGHSGVEITNVIPVYDDPRVQSFLVKHAPTLLEYTASIGMRRVLAEIPQTYTYTLAAGTWKMIETLSKSPTEGNVNIFCQFARDFHQSMKGHFDYVLDHMAAPQAHRMSFYLSNNGITNCMDPILQLVNPDFLKNAAKHHDRGVQNMPRILRALYSFETYQAMRRFIRKEDEPEPFIQQTLHTLLGVDLDANATPLQPLFEPEPSDREVTHCSQYTVNNEKFKELWGLCWYIDYLALLPSALAAVGKQDPVAYVREHFRAKSPQVVCDALGLTVIDDSPEKTLARFHLCNIVQAFLAPSKAERVDDGAAVAAASADTSPKQQQGNNKDNNKPMMKIVDVGFPEQQQEMLSGFVSAQYANQYRRDVVNKTKRERRQIVIELIKRLLAAPTMSEFCDLLRSGLKRGPCSDAIVSSSHAGFMPLRDKLLSLAEEVPLRTRKLACLVIGRDEKDEPVFNGGNVIVKGLEEIEALFESVGEHTALEELRIRWKRYARHLYRSDADGNDMPNRHSHCNGKPSYLGLGFPTLEAMAAAVSEKEMREYERVHWNCCGIPQMKGLCVRRKERFSLAPPSWVNGDDDGAEMGPTNNNNSNSKNAKKKK